MLVANEQVQQAAGFPCLGQGTEQPLPPPPQPSGQAAVGQLLAQAGMAENVMHPQQYNPTNCCSSFNTYSMPVQQMNQTNFNQGGQPMAGQQSLAQVRPFYPCFPAQQQLPRWTPTAP